MYCTSCGEKINEKEIFCKNCGKPIENTQRPSYNQGLQSSNQIKVIQKWYETNVAIILLLIFFFPVGLFLMWKFGRWKNGLKVGISIFVAIIFIYSYGNNDDTETGNTPVIAGTVKQNTTEEKDVENIEPKIVEEAPCMFEGIESNQEENAINVLRDCGIEKIKKVERDTTLDDGVLRGYKLKTEYSLYGEVTVYFDNEKIRQVLFLNKYLYQNQKVISVATDHYITLEEEVMYKIKCEDLVKSILKAPSTAKFPGIGEWGMSKTDGDVIVQGYVDSQNSFGAMLRSEFQLKTKKDVGITSFIFDGKEYVK